jgi:hypothetical protein
MFMRSSARAGGLQRKAAKVNPKVREATGSELLVSSPLCESLGSPNYLWEHSNMHQDKFATQPAIWIILLHLFGVFH